MNKGESKICTCMCHQKGTTTMHMMACCQYTYQNYINEDGSFDQEAYDKIVEDSKEE